MSLEDIYQKCEPIILEGRPVVDEIVSIIGNAAKGLRLKIFYDYNHKPSILYTNRKKKFCESLGIEVSFYDLNKMNTNEFNLESRKNCNGVLVQLPVPIHFQNIQTKLPYSLDIEGFGFLHLAKQIVNQQEIIPCTPAACIKLLDFYEIPIKGKTICIINDSMVLGRPLAIALLNRQATPIICHKYTKNLQKLTKSADIIISGVGQEDFQITPDYVNTGVDFLDVATRIVVEVQQDGTKIEKIYGDLHPDTIQLCNSYSPKIGGVGPVTVAMVAYNLAKLSGKLHHGM